MVSLPPCSHALPPHPTPPHPTPLYANEHRGMQMSCLGLSVFHLQDFFIDWFVDCFDWIVHNLIRLKLMSEMSGIPWLLSGCWSRCWGTGRPRWSVGNQKTLRAFICMSFAYGYCGYCDAPALGRLKLLIIIIGPLISMWTISSR